MSALAALSPVGVCARAFGLAEHRGFADFDDGSEEAAEADRLWDVSRRYVLAAAPWSFATAYARADAALAGVVAPASTPYVVTLAPDCLSFRRLCDVGAPHRAVPFGDRLLRTDVAPPFVYEYTADATELMAWQPAAAEALALWLAHQFAGRFARSPGLAERLLNRYAEILGDAIQTDARLGGYDDHRPAGSTADWPSASQAP